MKSCAFFGHRDYNYIFYKDKIKAIIIDVIENHGVQEFYNGFRGNFDRICVEIVFALKAHYPDLKNIMVQSYHNHKNFVLPKCFDESVYLLEKRVPPHYAIFYTNQEMIQRSDFIISGVCYHYGGAYTAHEFARGQQKIILDIFED